MVYFTVLGLVIACALIGGLLLAGYKYFTGNIHVVDKGGLIRSAQLSPRQLEALLKKYKPKAVISLRGDARFKNGQPERPVVEQYGAKYYPLAMSSEHFPSPENLNKLIDIYLDLSNYPIYVHCLGGADRTGEAAAIYQLLIKNTSKEEALKQLSYKYFHFRSMKPAKSYFIKEWKGLEWARTKYRSFE